MKSTPNTSYEEELSLGGRSDNLIGEMRLQGINNFFYILSSFLLCWMIWQFSIVWLSYNFGIASEWTGNSIEFIRPKVWKWTKYRITVTFLLVPVIYMILGLFCYRSTMNKKLRIYRPFFTWMFLSLMSLSMGQFFVGLLARKYISYIGVFMGVPRYLYPLFCVPLLIAIALLGRPLETLLLRIAARQRMLSTEMKQTYLFTTALFPMLVFIALIALLMIPQGNWIMFFISLTSAIPVAVATIYGGKRYNFRSVKPYTPKLSIVPIIIAAALLVLIRIINLVGYNGE